MAEKRLKAASYIQTGGTASETGQREILRNLAAANHCDIAKEYVENGGNMDLPKSQFHQFYKAANAGRYQAVLVSTAGILSSDVVGILRQRGVRVLIG